MPDFEDALAALTHADDDHGSTHALMIVHDGRIASEFYAGASSPATTLRSWSIAKSFVHAFVGILLADGRLDLAAPAPVPAWTDESDPRHAITLEHLLRMVDGLDFVEHDAATGRTDVAAMLYGRGRRDVAAYAENRAAKFSPGAHWSYSSAATIVLCGIIRRSLGGRDATESFMHERLFDPVGLTSAKPRFDAAGTYLGSSYMFATAADFASFGRLYSNDGMWNGSRILPERWVDHARKVTAGSQGRYGAHWWIGTGGPATFAAQGFEGQYLVVAPAVDTVIVRLGASTLEQRARVEERLQEIVASFGERG